MSTLSLNPMLTTNAAGSFGVKSQGWYQGVAMDDPAARYALAHGYVDSAATSPLWGGLPITELVPTLTASPYGSKVQPATSRDNLTGFSVFNQGHNGLVTPQSTVPLFMGDMSIGFYRFGSGARIPLPVSASVIALQASGLPVNQKLIWNFATNQLDVFSTVAATVKIGILTVDGDIATAVTETAHGLAVGSYITVENAVEDAYNGTYQVLSVPNSTTVTYQPTTTPAAAATTMGSIVAASSSGLTLPVQVIALQEGNCKTVSYDDTTNFATWADDGNLALVLM